MKVAHPEAAQPAASAASSRPSTITTSGARENGYIATLRDNFGFLMCVVLYAAPLGQSGLKVCTSVKTNSKLDLWEALALPVGMNSSNKM